MNRFNVVEGTTAPLIAPLLDPKGQPFNAYGMTLALTMATGDGSAVPLTTNKVTWEDIFNSVARFNPDPGDWRFSASPYEIRWIVTDTTGASYPFPWTPKPDLVIVGKALG